MDYLNSNEDQDNKLRKALYNLKETLQIKYYNNETNRKPNICKEEVIESLVKYKPVKLEDMHKIKGIGDNFIDNYGQEFINEIKNYANETKIELGENEKKILKKLENRLININKRNRLLYSSKVNKDYGIDITKIIENTDDFINFIVERKSSKYKIMDIQDFNEDKLKSLLRLIRQVNRIINESGNNELYVAYPFVQGKMENGDFNIKAPLMLFPVKLEREANIIYLMNDSSRNILYNTHLILANNKFNGKNEVLPNNEIDEYESNDYIEKMLKFYSENNFFIKKNKFDIEKFLENKKDEFPKYKNGEIELKGYAVIGIYSMYTTSMYADFQKMIENSEITALIKKLLDEYENDYDDDNNSTNNIDIIKLTPKDEGDDKIEKDIYYINELDFSQEKVLKEIQNTDALVVQGPPGTGKSQTITSVIIQSIINDKNVLMVSEKKTALDVIYSRLGEFSKFAIIIDDDKNKDLFYKQLENIINIDMPNGISNEENQNNIEEKKNKVKNYIDNINKNIDKLNNIANKIYKINDFGTSYYNLYNNSQKIDINNEKEYRKYIYINSNLTDNINKAKYDELKEILNYFNNEKNTKSIYEYLQIKNKAPFILNIKLNLTDIELLEFKKILEELKNYKIKYDQYNKIKKIINIPKLNKYINDIMEKYFNSKEIRKDIINNIDYIYNFICNKYSTFISNKYIYDKLSLLGNDYADIIYKVRENFEDFTDLISINKYIYNIIIYNKINDFEKDNKEVLNYINNFDNIIKEINTNIIKKKEITKEFAYLNLMNNKLKLNENGKLNKIREICNKKRKMSINKFMDKFKYEMTDSIRIWLMTPEVVSNILPFEKNIFDLVIFDEASQMFVENAIPAIYRAKKALISGDQKQLRPSSLGKGRILDDPDEEEVNEDLLEYESLLDATRYKFKHTMLNYHYRSKYSELIDFSNYAFYNRKLIVTSSPSEILERPIERIKVEEGRWIDKKNIPEAEEVIKLIKKILKERKNNETIGVITFNVTQMNLIEEYIEKEKMIDKKFAIDMNNEEQRTQDGENIGFFVKNIESVQGDERDIIIFCIGYAKNENERVAINFGWLNQDGGENRLNVAISRAKNKIYVITSIEPDELVVDNTKNNGPKLFKEYLKYAKAISENNNTLAQSILQSLLDSKETEKEQLSYDSVFEEEVCNRLIEEGYNISTQYGVGGYRIDIVVKSQDGKNILLGIECDGKIYHSSKFARERDYHRQKYLESRGWKIYRIWSTNWWRNPDLEIRKLNAYIDSLK